MVSYMCLLPPGFCKADYFLAFTDSLSLLGESDEFLEQEGFIEEEEMISGEDVMSEAINTNRHQLKRRRLFRAPRERQRGEEEKKKKEERSRKNTNGSHLRIYCC